MSSAVNLIGSTLDVPSIVDSFIYVESAPVRSMESQVSTLQSKASALQNLNTRLSSLSDKVSSFLFGDAEVPLSKPFSFYDRLAKSAFSKCIATSSAEDAISASSSNAATTGAYSITVSSLAQAQSYASAGFADATSPLAGTGTITIARGDSDPLVITINSTNNTLTGIRNAINNARAGVTATIINDGSSAPYKLLLTANDTGTANSFTVTENLTGGQQLALQQKVAAADAHFTVNGIDIVKGSNSVSDVIDGVTFTLKAETAGPVTINVDRDVDSIVASFNEIIAAYNEVNSFLNSQFTYNPTTKKAGVLSGDSTLRYIQSKLHSDVTQGVSNRFSNFRVASQVGLDFGRDGSLKLNESKFREALADDFTGVAALFLGDGTPSGGATAADNRVTYNGKTEATQAGTYEILIDRLAEQAVATGSQPITTLTADETLTITSPEGSAVITLLENDSLDTVLSKINNELAAQWMSIIATDDGSGRIRIATNGYGSSQTFTIFSDRDGSAGSTGFASAPMEAVGVDIGGTINGHAAIGQGLNLSGAEGEPEEGLSLTIAQTSIGYYGTVTVASDSQGTEGASLLMNLVTRLDGLTDPLSGPIHHASDAINQNIRSINEQITKYQERLEIRRMLLTEQFNRADQALRLLSVAQSSLGSQLSSLPK